jgi:hypothetical protein
MAMAEGDLLPSISAYGGLRHRERRYLPRSENARLLDPRAHANVWVALDTMPLRIRLGIEARDPAALNDTLRVLDDLERQAPGGSPLLDHYRGGVCAALAVVTGVKSWLDTALAAELRAIERGFVQAETIRPALDYCVEAARPEGLLDIARLVNHHGAELDPDTKRLLHEAASRLGIETPRLDR